MKQARMYQDNLLNTVYIDGNAARKLRPERKERPDSRRNVGPREDKQARAYEKALPMNGPYVAFMIVVTFVCILMCVAYLSVQSNIRETRDNISGLRAKISTVQTQNNALDYRINSYVNVDHIYKEATTKLGMKQASDNQIVTYKSSDSGYTLQYGEIPNK